MRCELPCAHHHITGGLHIALRPYSDIMPHRNCYRVLLPQQVCWGVGTAACLTHFASLRS